MNYIEQYLQQIQRGKCNVSKRVRREYERLADDIKHPKRAMCSTKRKRTTYSLYRNILQAL